MARILLMVRQGHPIHPSDVFHAIRPMSQDRLSEHSIDPIFTERWSPRAFTGEVIDEATLFTFFEAARWAPSANNSQPWRFIYARNGAPAWASLLNLLNENNQKWAVKASALVILISRAHHVRKDSTEPAPLRTHSFDAGAAWISLAFQALRAGWRTHAIGGFDRDRARTELGIPDDYNVEIAIAIGRQGDRASLSSELQKREQPTQRNPIGELVAEGHFRFAEN